MLDFLIQYFQNLLNNGYDKIFVGENNEEKTIDIINFLDEYKNIDKTAKFAIEATGQSTSNDVAFCNGILYILKCLTKNENIEFFDVKNCIDFRGVNNE